MVGETSKIILILEYDGTNYYGFQFQKNEPTIQAKIEEALLKLTGEDLRVLAASRTDTGVHARGQVVCFRTVSLLPPVRFIEGLNFYLPEDIAVRAAYRVNDSFNVRSDAVSREYKYCVLNSLARSPLTRRYTYQVKADLNIGDMDLACRELIGRHDLIAFASELAADETESTVREIYRAEVMKQGEMVVFDIVASSFLRHQIRNTAGALIRVGMGKMSINEFKKLMEIKKPGKAGPAAPACGLCLEKVNYPQPFQE